jgi:hypothetical protein
MDIKSLIQSLDTIKESVQQPPVQVINDFDEVVVAFDHMPKGLRDNLHPDEFDAVQWLADIMKDDPDFDMTTIEKIVLAPGVYGSDEHVIDVTKYINDLNESIHKGTYGTSYGKEDVRDQYGHRVGKVNKDAEAKKDEPKKGRGRPKKGAGTSGEDKTYDSSALSAAFGGGKKPNKEVGTKSVKHSLKDWIEDVAQSKTELHEAEQVTIKPMPGASQIMANGKPIGTADAQTANVIKQAAEKGTLNLTGDDLEESGLQAYLGNKKYGEKGMDALRKAGQKHASEKEMQNIRAKFSKKEEPMEEGHDEGKPGRNFAKIAKDAAKHYGSKEAGERVAGAVRAKLMKQGKLEEVKDLPGNQEKLDVAKPKGKLDAKDFAALRAKKKVKESINFKDLMATADSEIQEMLIELQNDVELFKDTGHISDLLDSFLKVHLHHNKNKITDESSIEDHTTHGMDSKPARFDMVDTNPTPTSFKVDPIQATTDRIIGGADKAGSFLKNLVAPKKTFESNNMKDIQFENWEKELNSLLNEGITVSSSQGQQGSPDSVSVNATDSDAQHLLQVLRQAGVGVFGGDTEHSQYGAPMNSGTEGHGTNPESSPSVVGDGDDMMALIKKMTGIQDSGNNKLQGTLEPADEEGYDYEDEEGHEHGEEECDTCGSVDCQCDDEEKLDELSPETISSYQQKATPQAMDASNPKSDQRTAGLVSTIGRKTTEEEQTDEGNEFSGELAKAKEQHKDHFSVGGKEYPVKEEHDHEEETCNECGMYESRCECEPGEEQVDENFANEPDEELMRLKDLLGMGNDLHRQKHTQAVGNPTQVTFETKLLKDSSNLLTDWQKLSGIK